MNLKRQQLLDAITNFQPKTTHFTPTTLYNVFDANEDMELVHTNYTLSDLIDKCRDLWDSEDDDPSDSEVVHSKLDNLDITFDEVNNILLGCGFIAEPTTTKEEK